MAHKTENSGSFYFDVRMRAKNNANGMSRFNTILWFIIRRYP